MNKLIFVTIMFLVFSCKAQSPIIDINDRQSELVDGAYLKDVYNELDKFVGTWLYSNGTILLEIRFQKKTQVFNDSWYEDLLVGEYRYVENGVEKINTLSNLDNQNNLDSPYAHNLVGSPILLKYEFPGCPDCDPNEKRVKVSFTDPSSNLEHLKGRMYMGLRYINDIPEKIQIHFAKKGTAIVEDGAPQEPTVPFGTYLLIKQ